MEEHPLVRFVDGPAGRRACLIGSGLDVWEVVSVARDNGGDVLSVAEYLEVPQGLVQAAINYYGAYTAEIDEWIEINALEGDEARSAWLSGRAALEH